MPTALDAAHEFVRALEEWFSQEGKDYPWRRSHDPYAILVSEMMLQQTTIAMVLERGHYDRWMRELPTVQALAAASEEQILRLWEGLGYYNRARNLKKTAQALVEHHGGQFPQTVEGLLSLPGIGRYTAGAVASFAFNAAAPLVDGNVARVFARLFDWDEEIDSPTGQKQLWTWAEALVPTHGARVYNSALMELGQRLCTTKSPTCLLCPVKMWCQTRRPEELPRKKPKRDIVLVEEAAWLIISRTGEILLERESGSRRRGLWRLPLAKEKFLLGKPLWQGKYTITHHRVTLSLHRWPEEASLPTPTDNQQWVSQHQLPNYPMPSPIRRALEAALAL